ncbi:hypothetical protein LCGC14_2962720, partial [marine sediment metagenome]
NNGSLNPPSPPWASKLMRDMYAKQQAMYASQFGSSNLHANACACSVCRGKAPGFQPGGPPLKHSALCPGALAGTNCQCGVNKMIAAQGPWQCNACGMYELQASNHTAKRCLGQLPKIVPISIDTAFKPKPGILTRIKRALGGWHWGM